MIILIPKGFANTNNYNTTNNTNNLNYRVSYINMICIYQIENVIYIYNNLYIY